MGIDLPPEIEDTRSPASLSAPAEPEVYIARTGSLAGQPITMFSTDVLKLIVKGGEEREKERGIFKAASDELDARVEAMEVKAASEGQRVIGGAPAAPQARMKGVSSDMPLPCGHPASMLERIEGEMFLSRCIGCARLDELEDAVEGITPRHVSRVMAAVRLWERQHHAPQGAA